MKKETKETACSLCGKTLDIFDRENGLKASGMLGYGSIHDGSYFTVVLCCGCTDKLIGRCKVNPLSDPEEEPDGTAWEL